MVITYSRFQYIIINSYLLDTKFVELNSWGKVESGETPLDAVLRELYEETGAVAEKCIYIAQYKVNTNDHSTFLKDVFFIEVSHFIETSTYYETNGPCLFENVSNIPTDKQSF